MNYSGTPAVFTPCLHEVSKIIENLILFKFFTGGNKRQFTFIYRNFTLSDNLLQMPKF